jgi:hypothetical protein
MWQHHLTVLIVLAVLALPVYLADHYLLRPQGDIFLLDLSGLVFTFYVLWLAVHVPVSSIAWYFLGTDRVYLLHAVTAVVSAGLLALGCTVVARVDSAQTKARYEARMTMRQALFDTIRLENWWYLPDAAAPEAIGAVIVVAHSGRLAASVRGRSAEPDRGLVYVGEMRPQQRVGAGDRIEYVFPLKYYGDHPAPDVAFSFMLFRDRSGSAPEDVIKQYVAAPDRADDGERFYDALPAPRAPTEPRP